MSSIASPKPGVSAIIHDAQDRTVPTALFLLYCYFLVDYFLHLSARIPVYPMFRPTLLLVALITLALFTQADKFKRIVKDPRLVAIWFLIGYIILSLPLVEWPGSVLRANFAEFVKAIVFLFFTAFIVDTDRRLRLIVGLWVTLQVVRVLEPLYLNLTEGYWGSGTFIGAGQFAQRLAGAPSDVINSNELGFVIVTAIPFLHFLMWGSSRWQAKLLYLALVPALLYALILTSSRGAMIALAVVALMILKESRHKAGLIIFGILVAITAWSQMSDFQKERYTSLFDESSQQHATVDGRWTGMINEFNLGMEKPIFGHGLGTTPEAKFNIAGGRAQASHNLYAELLIEIGIIGFILFMRYLWLVYDQMRQNLRRMKARAHLAGVRTSYEFRLNQALITTFWMYAVYSINYWGLSQTYWYFLGGLCVAFARSLKRNETKLPEPEPEAP
ncbi:MAG: O-antigen ligase family protein [Aquisalimonadaceae bacterium]